MTEINRKFFTRERLVDAGKSVLTFAIDLVATSSRPRSTFDALFGTIRPSATDTYLSNSAQRDRQDHEREMKEEQHRHDEEMLKLQIRLAEAQAKLQKDEITDKPDVIQL